MKKSIEIEAVFIPQYSLTVKPLSVEVVSMVKSFVKNITNKHQENFQLLAGMADSDKVEISRELTSDEKNKITDLIVNAEFDESQELEKTFSKAWEGNIISKFNS